MGYFCTVEAVGAAGDVLIFRVHPEGERGKPHPAYDAVCVVVVEGDTAVFKGLVFRSSGGSLDGVWKAFHRTLHERGVGHYVRSKIVDDSEVWITNRVPRLRGGGVER